MKSKIWIGVGALLLTTSGIVSGRELLLSGPVETVDHAAGKVTVLGHEFSTTATLSVGEVASIYGTIGKDGTFTDVVVQGDGTFATTSDPIFIKGIVASVDTINATATVSGVTVDYAAALGDAAFSSPTVGDPLAVAGIQGIQKGSVVASVVGSAAYRAAATGGTSAAATGGTSAASARFHLSATGGTSAAATGGTSAAATGGTSAAATGGTSAAATGGTSAAATGGTSAAATGGTSAAATGGTSAAATGGTSAAATGGTSAAATGGTSAAATGGTSAAATGGTSAY